MRSVRAVYQAVNRYFTDVPKAISIRSFRFYLVGHMAYHFAITVHFFWAVLFAALGVPELAVFNSISVCIFLFAIMANRRGYHLVPTVVAMCEIVAHQVLACWLIGTASNFQLYLVIVSLYPFIMPEWSRWIKLAIFSMPLAGFLAIELTIRGVAPAYVLDPKWVMTLAVSNVFFSFICLGILGNYLSFAVVKTEAQLDEEYDKSERLLLNVLPAPVAARLKANERVISDRLPDASILFADLVGFTRFAERLDPDDLVRLLNQYFSAFDELADRFGLEKIKTIGDAYMVAAGVPMPMPDHAICMAAFAIELRSVLHALNRSTGNTLQVRIGIHCGPVAAGVIGTRKFAYDLWGDTVNVASRMESLGEPDRIQVTRSFRDACEGRYRFTERGEVDVKGKGAMHTFFLDSAH